MEAFESKLDEATHEKEILGAAVSVVNKEGIIYQKFSGNQNLALPSPPIDHNTTFALESAGTFITHIAALQCVDNGFLRLDDPVEYYLPELKNPSFARRIRTNGEDNERCYVITYGVKLNQVTLRDLLSNIRGLDDDSNLDKQCEVDVTGMTYEKDQSMEAPAGHDLPLDDDKPGGSWSCKAKSRWVVRLIERLNKQPLAETVQELIFDALGMSSSVYIPFDNAEITSRLLQPVERTPEGLKAVGVEDLVDYGVVTTINDLSLLLSDLVSPDCSILKPESLDSFFECNLTDEALQQFRTSKHIFTAYAGIAEDELDPPVSYSLGGLIVEEELELSKMPPSTVTWNGVPNIAWAVNRECGLGMIWATQLFPEDDEKCVDIAMEFFRGAWEKFRGVFDPASMNQASMEEASMEEASMDEASMDEASMDETSMEETSMDEDMADSGFGTQTPSDNDAMELDSSHSDDLTTHTPPATTPAAGKGGKRKSNEMDSLISPAPKASKRWPPTKMSLEDDMDSEKS